jgi:pilus assembly protein Flp/PilA
VELKFLAALPAQVRSGSPLENVMNSLFLKVQRFLESEDGPTAVEYAVMLALIIVVCLTAITAIGTNANATFDSVAQKLQPTAS